MMEDPIPVSREGRPPMSTEDRLTWEKQKAGQRLAMVMVVTVCIVVLCFFVPLGVWLTRLAMGA